MNRKLNKYNKIYQYTLYLQISPIMLSISNENTNICCTCHTCTELLQITDGDYEHDFLNQNSNSIEKIYRPFRKILHTPQLHDSFRSKYVKFNRGQKKYLKHVFEIYPFVGCHDINKTRIIFICDNLIKIGYTNQKITKSMIMSWFKNERFRRNHHNDNKKRKIRN